MKMPHVAMKSKFDRHECLVRGPLALTLHVSRALGMAPLRMERARIGWRISYSRPFAIYSYVWMSLLHTVMLYGLYQDYCSPIEDTYRMRYTASAIGWTAIILINCSICTIGVITGPKRMRLLIDYVYKMDNIHKKFSRTKAWRPNEKKKTLATAFTIFVLFFIYIYTYVNTVISVLDAGTNWRGLFLFPCTYTENMMVHLVMMQFALVGYMIESSMKYMNRSFDDLIHLDDSQIKPRSYRLVEGVLGVMIPLPKFGGIATVAERRTVISEDTIMRDSTDLPSISTFGCAYAVLCNAQLQVNESFGTLLILIMATFFVQLLVSVYSYVFSISATQDAQHVVGVSRCSMILFFLLMVIEPTESIKLQVQRMKFLLTHMYRRVEPDDPRCTELQFLYEQLTLDNPVFVISGLFKLRRSILFLVRDAYFSGPTSSSFGSYFSGKSGVSTLTILGKILEEDFCLTVYLLGFESLVVRDKRLATLRDLSEGCHATLHATYLWQPFDHLAEIMKKEEEALRSLFEVYETASMVSGIFTYITFLWQFNFAI